MANSPTFLPQTGMTAILNGPLTRKCSCYINIRCVVTSYITDKSGTLKERFAPLCCIRHAHVFLERLKERKVDDFDYDVYNPVV